MDDFENLTGNLMDIHGLQVSLKKEINRLLSGMHLTDDAGNEVQIHAFEQQLPETYDDEDDPSQFFPYFIVQVFTGDTEDDEDPWHVTTVIQFGIKDKGKDRQGHIQILSMIQKVANRFLQEALLDNQYRASPKMKWEILDENTYPFYFGAIEMKFSTPKMGRIDEFS